MNDYMLKRFQEGATMDELQKELDEAFVKHNVLAKSQKTADEKRAALAEAILDYMKAITPEEDLDWFRDKKNIDELRQTIINELERGEKLIATLNEATNKLKNKCGNDYLNKTVPLPYKPDPFEAFFKENNI